SQESVFERKLDRKPSEPHFRTELIRGRVLWQADALKNEFDITSVPEAAKSSLAFLTVQGKLLPIVENLRGRAFRKDVRLRDRELELSVRIYEKHPYVQVVTVYEVDGDRRYEIDYWCDVCAIVMYETGACACCQDANRMRKRIVKNGIPQDEEAKE
ncbi:MAG TPA: hypothetical protein VM260_13190, partial [Pirellula sp.]|nr:hypothetical protein [Pirellula sp.]